MAALFRFPFYREYINAKQESTEYIVKFNFENQPSSEATKQELDKFFSICEHLIMVKLEGIKCYPKTIDFPSMKMRAEIELSDKMDLSPGSSIKYEILANFHCVAPKEVPNQKEPLAPLVSNEDFAEKEAPNRKNKSLSPIEGPAAKKPNETLSKFEGSFLALFHHVEHHLIELVSTIDNLTDRQAADMATECYFDGYKISLERLRPYRIISKIGEMHYKNTVTFVKNFVTQYNPHKERYKVIVHWLVNLLDALVYCDINELSLPKLLAIEQPLRI